MSVSREHQQMLKSAFPIHYQCQGHPLNCYVFRLNFPRDFLGVFASDFIRFKGHGFQIRQEQDRKLQSF